MSRSRKKTPCCNGVKPDGSWKAIYNRKVRRNRDPYFPNGNCYRKMNESYNIHEWRVVGTTFLQYQTPTNIYGHDRTLDEKRLDYERYFLRK